ncbi:DNA repair protein endonuclease SAE2/CtIP C-terminus-domain-containing protein [Schizophyllum fasciatum]
MEPGFSSAQMRLRDQKVAEKHQAEIRKLENLCRTKDTAYKHARTELYDCRQRADHFARRLGFADLADGELQLANAEVRETYEEALTRLAEKERELERANARIEVLEEDRMIWEQVGKMKGEDSKGQECDGDACPHERAVANLRAQIDTLQSNFARAQERYKKDYAKMKAHMRFMRGDEDAPNTSARQATQNLLKRRRDVKGEDADMPNLDDLDEVMGTGFVASVDELDQQTRTAKRGAKVRKRRAPLGDRENTAPNPSAASPTRTSAPSIPTFNLSTPQRKVPRPVPPSPSAAHDGAPSILVPDSSLIITPTSSPPTRPLKLEPPASPSLAGPSRPRGRRSDVGPSTRTAEEFDHGSAQKTRAAEGPPRKMRRLSDGARGASTTVTRQVKQDEADTPRRVKEELVDADRTLVEDAGLSGDRKGKGRAYPSTPANARSPFATPKGLLSSASKTPASRSKAEADYSKYKGRGRYGKEQERGADAGDTTINAAFAIDRERNGGADFQFADVVRGREGRRGLQATDCECCREYYEAVGPLPPRQQAPLWRSPSRSPTEHRPGCTHEGKVGHGGSDNRGDQAHREEETRSHWDEGIQAHRQAISRHRERWERAKTPPGYWEIGFPSTQEAEDINERAREMHREKLRAVEAEAERGEGRWRRRWT